MTDHLTACPECDSSHINRQQPTKPCSPETSAADWLCAACGAHFEEPTRRPPHQTGGGLAGLAGALDAADPEAVSADD